MTLSEIRALIQRLEKAPTGSNELDVLMEQALFRPDAISTAIRANNAGTKIIVTMVNGLGELEDHTFWARDWTTKSSEMLHYIKLAKMTLVSKRESGRHRVSIMLPGNPTRYEAYAATEPLALCIAVLAWLNCDV